MNIIDKQIRLKKELAKITFKRKQTPLEVKQEVLDQIVTCEELSKPLSTEMIYDICSCKNVAQVRIMLHDYKIA